MKIQIVAQISGTRNGADWPAVGGVIDVPADEAAQLISTGLAREPEKKTAPVVETAVAAKAETRKGLTTKSI